MDLRDKVTCTGIKLPIKLNYLWVGCISFCVVSCYSTIKVRKNDCSNVLSPIYIVFGHCSVNSNHNEQRKLFVSIYSFHRQMKPLKIQTKTLHCSPKKIFISVKFPVHKLTYLEK